MPAVWFRRHTGFALVLSLAALGLALLLPSPSLERQAMLLAGFVALLGLPHGAVDHWQGRDLLAGRYRRRWPLVFGACYSFSALAIAAAWLLWPPLLLTGFLLLAVVHFGAEDAAVAMAVPGTNRTRHALDAGLRGAMPVLLPVLLWPETTGTLFAALLPGTDNAPVIAMLNGLAPLAPIYLLALAALVIAAFSQRRFYVAAEVGTLVAVFAALPPLLAFILYFCFWHAPRHSLRVMAARQCAGFRAASRSFVLAAMPLTLVTIAAASLTWAALLATGHVPPATAALQIVFIGLAALTVPHVALAACHQRASLN